jgi:hypothetical protein
VRWSDGKTDATRTDTNVTQDIHVIAEFALKYVYFLIYTAGDGGSIVGEAWQEVGAGGSGTPVTAVPNEGYYFVRWSDGKTDATRTDTNIIQDIGLTAQFALKYVYFLIYTAGDGGSIVGEAWQEVEAGGSGTPVTAVPHEGYHFVSWNDNSTINPRRDTNVTQDIGVIATFAIDTINTLPGNNVAVQPADNITGITPVTLTFQNVTESGITTLSTTPSGQAPPQGLRLAGSNGYYQITTMAVFSGTVIISITYDPTGIQNPDELKLYHFVNESWTDVTTSVDSQNHIIYGSVSLLSPFAIFEQGTVITWVCPDTSDIFLTPSSAHDRPYIASSISLPTGKEPYQLLGVYHLDEISGVWEYFIPAFTMNTLDSLDPSEAYYMAVESACSWQLPSDQATSLPTGEVWVFPGTSDLFLAPTSANSRPYLANSVSLPTGTEPSELLGVYHLDETTGEWEYFIPAFTMNTLDSLDPGEAYYMAVSGACSWTLQ